VFLRPHGGDELARVVLVDRDAEQTEHGLEGNRPATLEERVSGSRLLRRSHDKQHHEETSPINCQAMTSAPRSRRQGFTPRISSSAPQNNHNAVIAPPAKP